MKLRLAWAGAALLSAEPFVALTTAFGNPGCLQGSSSAGLPYIVPTLTCFVLLGRGWYLFPAVEWKWRLLSWGYLCGASMFATTPLSRSLGWRLPAWEIWPLSIVAAFLLWEAHAALRSRFGRVRALSALGVAAAVVGLAAQVITAASDSWPHLVIGSVYGSLAAVLAADAYIYPATRSTTNA